MLTDINELWIRYLLLSEQFHYIQHFILFQYISCYSLSVQGAAEMPWLISFNTSHVTLYLRQASYIQSSVLVSIHLMLLFINVDMSSRYWYTSFNTSHVTLYQFNAARDAVKSALFQYISCYSLSIIKTLGHPANGCFNTSHVILYQTDQCKDTS